MGEQALAIAAEPEDPRRLSCAVLQATDMLGFYRAELARILGFRCADVGQLASGQRCLERGSMAWRRAQGYLRLYRALHELHGGDRAAMFHWLRVPHPELGGVPHLLLVDDGRLSVVLHYLRRRLRQARDATVAVPKTAART